MSVVDISQVNSINGVLLGVYYIKSDGGRYDAYGCSTLAIYGLLTLLEKKQESNLAELEIIKKEIRECDEVQGSLFPEIYKYLNKRLCHNKVDEGLTVDLTPSDVINKIFHGSKFICGVEVPALPAGCAHTGLLYSRDGRAYIDGIEVDVKTVFQMLYSSDQNIYMEFKEE